MQTQTFNIALPKELVKKADQVAKKQYRSRSELIREALRVYLEDEEQWNELFSYGKKKARQLDLKDEKDVDKLVAEFRSGRKRALLGIRVLVK